MSSGPQAIGLSRWSATRSVEKPSSSAPLARSANPSVSAPWVKTIPKRNGRGIVPPVSTPGIRVGEDGRQIGRRRERRSQPMIKIWSELPVSRTREQLADVATLIWVVFWGNVVWQLFQFLIGFAGVGRAVHEGGDNMVVSGQSLGDSLAGLPVVGSQARDLASGAFAAGGRPISDLGTGLEQFVTIVSVVLALLLALVTLGPWLIRYVPWRWE